MISLVEYCNMSDCDKVQFKKTIITEVDKKKYAKEILSGLDVENAKKTIEWLRRRYDIKGV
jgi:hypothetical protein